MKNREEYDGFAVKAVIRHVSETIRLQTHILFNVQVDKKSKISDPKKLWRFSWDYESSKAPQTEQEMKKVMKAIAKGFKHLKGKDGKGSRRR